MLTSAYACIDFCFTLPKIWPSCSLALNGNSKFCLQVLQLLTKLSSLCEILTKLFGYVEHIVSLQNTFSIFLLNLYSSSHGFRSLAFASPYRKFGKKKLEYKLKRKKGKGIKKGKIVILHLYENIPNERSTLSFITFLTESYSVVKAVRSVSNLFNVKS